MNYSKKALWLACSSEFSERLAEITEEHISLAKELAINGWSMTAKNREIIKARADALRQERNDIISIFEEINHHSSHIER